MPPILPPVRLLFIRSFASHLPVANKTIYCLVFVALAALSPNVVAAGDALWSLSPVTRPTVPTDVGEWNNPIDAFIARKHKDNQLIPLERAQDMTLLRRVSFDLVGLPPSIEDQQAFQSSDFETAYRATVDRLLDSEQHGIRFGRHWLDVLRHADIDEGMPARSNLHLWRDWVINAINDDLPYDEFVRAQVTGYRSSRRTTISATGIRRRLNPRPDDVFALGFLSRGATRTDDKDSALALNAVETISSAFMGMTVGCAKCHDHFYDPIEQQDFYAMKALFDPLVLQPVQLASSMEIFEYGKKQSAYERKKQTLDDELDALIKPFHTRLYNERVEMLPPEVQEVIRKPESQRTADEQITADEYYPILRIDSPKLREIMPAETIKQYDRLRREISKLPIPSPPPVFWAVREDGIRKQQPRYVLNSGDANRPEKDRRVEPGFPFADPDSINFRDGLREGFVDWLTGPNNPLFARVAVNRIWQWHFGAGLHQKASDFGELGELPNHPELLDWLAAGFVENGYSMKWLHRLIVTSETYMRSSSEKRIQRNQNDPGNKMFWRFPMKRLEAEPIWDAIHQIAGDLDLSLGGPAFAPNDKDSFLKSKKRRAAFMQRGFRSSREVMPEFLRVFDVDDGRTPCPLRQQSVTAPQSLLLLNSPLLEQAAQKFATRIQHECDDDLAAGVDLAYRLALCRRPTEHESEAAKSYLQGDSSRLPSLCLLIFNLDEFIYVP